jgi:hypothetical protein
MNELAHLTDEAREEALLADAERVMRVRTERWIHYSRAQSVLLRMNELIEYPARDRMPCLLIYGATGMGKTKIIRKFLREHPTTFDNHLGITSARVVSMQMPPDPDEKSFYEELLGNLQAPTRFAANTTHLRRISWPRSLAFSSLPTTAILPKTSNGRAGQARVGRCCNYSARDGLRRFLLLIIDGLPSFVAGCDRPIRDAHPPSL